MYKVLSILLYIICAQLISEVHGSCSCNTTNLKLFCDLHSGTFYNGHCYFILQQATDFDNAMFSCQNVSLNGSFLNNLNVAKRLAHFKNQIDYENVVVPNCTTSKLWIGLRADYTTNDVKQYRWKDNYPTYSDYGFPLLWYPPTFPTIVQYPPTFKHACTFINNTANTWFIQNCSEPSLPLCEIMCRSDLYSCQCLSSSNTGGVVTVQQQQLGCAGIPGSLLRNGKCYFVVRSKVNWYDAQNYCRTQATAISPSTIGRLATFQTTDSDRDFELSSLLSSCIVQEYGIYGGECLWIGLKAPVPKAQSSDHRWCMDSINCAQPFNQTSEIIQRNFSESCVYLLAGNSLRNGIPCCNTSDPPGWTTIDGFICEIVCDNILTCNLNTITNTTNVQGTVLVAPQINNPCISTSSTTNIESTYESTTTTGHNTSPRWTTTISQDNTSHSGTTTTSQYNTSTSWVRSSPTSAAVSVSSETKENTISTIMFQQTTGNEATLQTNNVTRLQDRIITNISNCIFDQWSEFSPCSASCGEKGTKIRTMKPTNQQILSHCAVINETKFCHLKPCNPMTTIEQIAADALQTLGCTWLIGLCTASFCGSIFLRLWNTDRIIHACQELSLILAHILIALARNMTDHFTICTWVGIALQYLFTVNFTFVLLECLQVYTIVTSVIVSGNFFNLQTNLFIGWGAAVPIVIVTSVTSYSHYVSTFSCWLNLGHKIAAATITPIVACCSAGIVLLEATGQRNMVGILPDQNFQQLLSVRINQRSLLIKIPLSLAACFVGQITIYYQNIGLFTTVFALNVALGTIIFFFHFLANKEGRTLVRRIWQKVCCKKM